MRRVASAPVAAPSVWPYRHRTIAQIDFDHASKRCTVCAQTRIGACGFSRCGLGGAA